MEKVNYRENSFQTDEENSFQTDDSCLKCSLDGNMSLASHTQHNQHHDTDLKGEVTVEPEPQKNLKKHGLSMFANRSDIPCALTGLVFMVLAALGSPFQTYVYGKVFLKLANYLSGSYSTTSEFLHEVRVLCGAIMAIGLGRMFLTWISIFSWLLVGEKQQSRARRQLLGLVLHRKLGWFDSKKNLMGSVAQVNRCIEEIRSGISENVAMLVLAIALIIFLFINAMISLWALTLVVMASIPLMALSTYVFGALTFKYQKRENDFSGKASKLLDWSFVQGDLVRILNGKYVDMVAFNRVVELSARAFGRMALSIAGNSSVLRVLSNCIFVQGFWFGTYLLRRGLLGIDQLFTSFSSCLLFGVQIASIATIVALLNKAQAAAATINESDILSNEPPVAPEQKLLDISPSDCLSVSLDHVSFQYDTGDTVLQDVSAQFTNTGINFVVGESGCGKSTLVLLLMGFYVPLAGSISVGDVPISRLTKQQIFEIFTLVEPSPLVFDDTLSSNLRLGHGVELDSTLAKACEFANLSDFVRSQALGVDSEVSSSSLSGGQIQRIGLARAWLKNSPVLILDESLSAIDGASRKDILDKIRAWRSGRVTIYITHNPLEIQDCDRVLLLRGGKVAFLGSGHLFPRGAKFQAATTEPCDLSEQSIFSSSKRNSWFPVFDYLHQPAVLQDLEETSHTKDQEQPLLGLVQIVKFCFATAPSKIPLSLGYCLAVVCGFASPVLSYCVSKLLSTAVSTASYHGNTKAQTLKWSVIVICIALADGMCYFSSQSCLQLSLESWIVRLREHTMAMIDEQDMSFFASKARKPAELTALLMNDSRDLRVLVAEFTSSLLLLVALTCFGVTWSIVSGWKLALVGVAFVPLTIVLTVVYGMLLSHYETAYKGKVALVENFTHNAVSGIRTIRAFGVTGKVEQDLSERLDTIYTVGRKRALVTGLGVALLELFTSVATGTILYYGMTLVAAQTYTQTQLLQVLTLLTFTMASASSLMHQLPEITRGKRAGLRLFWLWKLDKLYVETNGNLQIRSAKSSRSVVFDHVDFSFADNASSSYKRVLRNLTFELGSGQTVALVGKSGSGKSTVALLLARLYEQDRGNITFCNEKITDFDVEQYRESVVLVPQHPRFFEGTILENFTYGMGSKVAELEIWNRLEQCNIADFVRSLPQGLNSQIGEGANTIASMGQMQRLNICRGLLRNPQVLMLDECTSYLDEANTRSIIDLVCKRTLLDRAMTVVLITHDVKVMEAASRIIVLSEGTIAEDGTFEELLLHWGAFYEVVN